MATPVTTLTIWSARLVPSTAITTIAAATTKTTDIAVHQAQRGGRGIWNFLITTSRSDSTTMIAPMTSSGACQGTMSISLPIPGAREHGAHVVDKLLRQRGVASEHCANVRIGDLAESQIVGVDRTWKRCFHGVP